jgi:prepilin-type N-terminal cleavage/methylation domain-containing protein
VIQAIQRRLAVRQGEDKQGGFTLIELMVVVMIIAILVGIAIPAFLGARSRAAKTAVKSNLRNGLAIAQTLYTDTQAYDVTATEITNLKAEEPSLTFQDDTAASTKPKILNVLTKASVAAGAIDEIVFAAKSDSGDCYYLRHINTPGANGGTYLNSSSSAACTATAGEALTTGWQPL